MFLVSVEESILGLPFGEELSVTRETIQVPEPPVTSEPDVGSMHVSGVHFLSHDSLELLVPKSETREVTVDPPSRRELLEYMIQLDGSVVCKWCGEVLPSRTHWYRHKYKFHVQAPPGSTSLFKCYRCNVFFKSRKGYHGHMASRHSGVDKKPVIKDGNSSSEKLGFSELELPLARNRRNLKDEVPIEEYEKQREKEEKLVADIIEKVRKECEAQGSTVTRRGYTRRQTVMNT